MLDFEQIQQYGGSILLIAIMAAVLAAIYRTLSQPRPDLSNPAKLWPKDHPVHSDPNNWEAFIVRPDPGIRSWFTPSFSLLDWNGIEHAKLRFFPTSEKEGVLSTGERITCPRRSRYSMDTTIPFLLEDTKIAEAISNFAMLRDKLELNYGNR